MKEENERANTTSLLKAEPWDHAGLLAMCESLQASLLKRCSRVAKPIANTKMNISCQDHHGVVRNV
jgi:hypothetical protein